jgi:6-pyruvoyltetrahydropterin/6-carboxytetrahydropterin synthase
MKKIRISKIFNFEMAHVLKNYDGPCKNIHGHSYKLVVTISGEPLIDPSNPKDGMLLDFSILKSIVKDKIVDKFDHAVVIIKGHKESLLTEEGIANLKVIETSFQPTSENLVLYFVSLLESELPKNITLEKLTLNETASSYVEWCREDNIN